MEFLPDYIGGDISDDEYADNDVFQINYTKTKIGSDERDYQDMEDFINQKLKLGSEDDNQEDDNFKIGSEIFDLEEDVILGAFEEVKEEEHIETIVGAFEEISDTETEIKSEIEELLKKL